MSVQHARALSPSRVTASSIPRSLLVSVTLTLFTNCLTAHRGSREEEHWLLGSLHRSPSHHEEERAFHSSDPGVCSQFWIMIPELPVHISSRVLEFLLVSMGASEIFKRSGSDGSP